jgi:hypothetical protein
MMIGSIDKSSEMYAQMGMQDLMDEHTKDMIKEMLAETNPYYLGLTFSVSSLHSVFEILSVKSGT